MVCQKVFDVVNPMINHAINQTFGLILHQSHLGEIMCFSIWFNVVNPVITNHPQYHYLVGGLEHFFIFPYILRRIIPTDEVIFFRWVGLNHQAAIWIGSLSPRGPGGSRIEVYLQPHSEALGLPRNVPWVPGRSGKIREDPGRGISNDLQVGPSFTKSRLVGRHNCNFIMVDDAFFGVINL